MRKIVEKSILGKVWTVSDDYNLNKNLNDADAFVRDILKSRGITDDVEIEKFLHPSVKEYMPDPFVLKDMDIATRVIADAVCAGDKIAIYGDYDVDGITSTALFVKYLTEAGVDVSWHLPTREGEGYGLNVSAVEQIAQSGVKLLITVDCGISGINEVKKAKELGLKVVVTDHHSPDNVLPDADAVVNPKRKDDTSNLDFLAGCGVAFLTLVALNRELRDHRGFFKEEKNEINLLNYMDLVALGTICDTMPLIDLNRAFVSTGLQVLGLRQNLGLRTLMDLAKIKKPSVYAVGFALGPRLNAPGRLNSAAPALELLLTKDPFVATDLANQLHKMNQERIDKQNAIMVDATDMAEQCCKNGKCSLFICGDNWHGGVMGIIAGRLKDKYNLPTCVATKTDGVINGSGRSIPDIDLGKIIHDAIAAGILSEGGGHSTAAGFTLNADNEQEFCDFLEKAVREQLKGERLIPEIFVDAQLDASGANMNLVKEMAVLAPFGQCNPEPTLVLTGGVLKFATTTGEGSPHLRGVIKTSNGGQLSFVGFNLVGTPVGNFLLDDMNTNTKIMMLGKLKENEYNGRTGVQFIVEDIAI
ncbi:MAG: single-stranded-DNA-specific exonuclease RecJ [Alphaproteobacteria bacterium]|nr:single-stranded-DNA-specific exonuclease RecJ [Alphaproteobacteria bacterium]